MKKLLLFTIAFCLIAGASFSQISFGPKAGVNLSTYAYSFKESSAEPEVKFRTGPAIGAVMDLELLPFLSFQPSVLFSIKGVANDVNSWSVTSTTLDGYDRVRIMYFEVPANFAAKLDVGSVSLQIFAGPYFAMAMAGVERWDITATTTAGSETNKDSERVKFRAEVDEDDWNDDDVAFYQRRLDLGVDFGIGVKFNQLLFNIGYAMGLKNLQPDAAGGDFDPGDYKYSNRSIFVNAAWLFGGE